MNSSGWKNSNWSSGKWRGIIHRWRNRKFFFAALAVGFVMSLLFPLTASAADACENVDFSKPVKVYLTESFGGGCEVFHITLCSKVAAKAPLKCNFYNWEQNREQCARTETEQSQEEESEEGEQRLRVPYKAGADIHECKIGNAVDANIQIEKDCKSHEPPGVWRSKQGDVMGAWTCSEGSVTNQECPGDKRVLKGVVVVEQGTSPDNAKPQLRELYPELGGNFNVSQLFEIGQEIRPDGTRGEKTCATGDYKVVGVDGHGDALGGDVDGFDPWTHLEENLPEGESSCRTVNASPLFGGAGKPFVSCSRGYVIATDSGVSLLSEFIGSVFQWAAGIVGLLAVAVMVISGIQISMAQGDTAKVDAAKTRIMESIAGLAVLFLAWIILRTINPNFFQ